MNQQGFEVAVKAIIRCKDNYLVLRKSAQEDVRPGTYDLPGGRVVFGEELHEALVREVKEEKGLAVKVIKPVNAWTFKLNEYTQLAGITYLCVSESMKIVLSHEHQEAQWMTL